MNKICFFILLFLIQFPFVFAEDIVMFVDQSEYYFRVGEDAVIPLEIQNNYGYQISGMLQYTITQQLRQANTQISSSNTQASTFTIDDGVQTVSLDFGTSDYPFTLTVNLSFIYNDDVQINVFFDPITIHFVADDSQKNNIQNKMQSTSQQGSSAQNNPSSQQSIQQKLDELMNQQSLTQDPQQRLQNNQLAQDSNMLKKEIQQQLQEENSLKKEFKKHLVSNDDFQTSHQQLLQQGYNVTSGSLNPISTLTGDFEVNYENEQGKWAKIQGSMVNGTLTEIEKQTQEEQERLLAKLRADATFQEYVIQLTQEGFSEQNIDFIDIQNKTSISIGYVNEEIQNATIKAQFVNGELTDVLLEKASNDFLYLLYILAIAAIVIVSYLLNKKIRERKKIAAKPTTLLEPEKFDYVLASKNLIEDAKNSFKEKRYKDAYEKASQSIRFFLSHDLNLNKEITNEDILLELANTEYPIDEISHCFEISSLVEFAKQVPDEGEFYKMVALAEDLIKEK